jgi:DNA-binding transcriptional MerR regulator
LNLKTYIRALELRRAAAERGFILRIRRALRLTIAPIYEAIERNPDGAVEAVEALLKDNYIKEALRWLYVDWGYNHMKWVGKTMPFERKDDFWQDRLTAIFEAKTAEKITAILDFTKEKVRQAIKDTANQGYSIDKIQKVIKEQMEQEGGAVSIGRARTIARTEVIGASNVATHETVQQAVMMGSNIEKRWVTGGTNIRQSHKDAEAAGWIPFDQPFILAKKGGIDKMMHPSDPSGSAENVINCKCVEVFRTV